LRQEYADDNLHHLAANKVEAQVGLRPYQSFFMDSNTILLQK